MVVKNLHVYVHYYQVTQRVRMITELHRLEALHNS